MISICRGVLFYDLPLSYRSVPSHSLLLVRLFKIDLLVIHAVPSSLSLIRYGGRDDDVPRHINLRTISMTGGGSYQGASFISIRSCSRSPTPFCPVSSLIRYEKRDGAYLSVLVPLSVVSRSYPRCSGR